MMESFVKIRVLISAIKMKMLALGLLCGLFLSIDKATGNNDSVLFSENANLALRRTAHLLLAANGDSTSRIKPVKQSDNTFTVQLGALFDYDKLPDLLQESLTLHGISRGYNVTLINCENEALELGYSFLDLKQNGSVPCGGRKKNAGCYLLKVRFEPETKLASSSNWWLLTFGSLLAGLGFIVWKRKRKDHVLEVALESGVQDNAENIFSKIRFGNSTLDIANLSLISGNKTHNLTYREGKLLNLFTDNKNQILERDFILKSVWEDEGIIVGRSVDVFVSRLRKMLAGDSNVKISAIHGVGYRLEVSE
ncbi:winged helix-turn-helix domain-containing protein [Dyadobacter sp. LHD-138]|uniref:winged helix-turn-helix domain-containing protein n=1 Tax=Dyadobacter sp. LHD-138 TaxID=3071413 RepID=UPI0027DFC92D|nr:winged helix-turn-helix domain-containing protein [Dyadobacter sp. LHD-138]MDQ6479153.1 winged helix-turn-helix domain-containing protein [Dyadobacter sp. LHD-138]